MKKDSDAVVNVMIVDDHVLYRAGVKTALSSKKDIKVIAEADNGQHLLDMLKAVQPDVRFLPERCWNLGLARYMEPLRPDPHLRVARYRAGWQVSLLRNAHPQ